MAELVIDPVCKMQIDPDTAAAKSDFSGTTYYFCAAGCKLAFDEEPSKYLNSDVPSAHAVPQAAATSEAPAVAAPAGGESKPPWWQFWRT